MGRHRTKHRDLPPGVYASVKNGVRYFYYGKRCLSLGKDYVEMLVRYAQLHEHAQSADKTFAFAVSAYLGSDEFKAKKPKTQREYGRQAVLLTKVFGATPIDQITPKHVHDYMKARRAKISATREKALLSLVFEFARREGMTNMPNPVAGIRGTKSRRCVYVRDDQLTPVLEAAEVQLKDVVLADFLRATYYTGQDVGRVIRWTVQDVRNGRLWNERDKTGEKVQIAVEGPLAEILSRLMSGKIGTAPLFCNPDGSRITLQAIRRRFWAARKLAGQAWQLRDLRAKAASDVETLEGAQSLLAHSDITTTAIYRRQTSGTKAKPVMRRLGK